MSWSKDCQTSLSPTALDGIDPNDFTHWGYVKNSQDPDNVSICNEGMGDPYLGMITNECEYHPYNPVYNNVPYRVATRDRGTQVGLGQLCGFPKCKSHSDKGYGQCGLTSSLHNKYHYWWQRDWNNELNTLDKKAFCCAYNVADPERTMKCPTDMWYNSPKCNQIMKDKCNPVNQGWNSDCDSYVQSNLTQANGYPDNATSLFVNSMDTWISNLDQTDQKPDVNDPFLDTLLDKCNIPQFQGLCNSYLGRLCSKLTKEDLSNDKTGKLSKVCACYLPGSEYPYPGAVPPECDSSCQMNATSGIPIYEYVGGDIGVSPKVCKQNTCVMDNVTINYINSNIGGQTTFNQMCGDCQGGTCTCVMDGVDINTINSTLKDGITLQQTCGVISGGDGITTSIEGYTSLKEKSNSHYIIFYILLFIVMIFIVIKMRKMTLDKIYGIRMI